MKRGDSFSAGMFATFGVLAALAIVGAAIYFGQQERERQAAAALTATQHAEDARARKLVMPELKLYGIVKLSDDTGLTRDGADTVLVGSGIDQRGDMKRLMVHLQAAKFGQTTSYKIRSINIEGRVVYEAKQ